MSYTINGLRESGYNRIADVYEIFQNFFGERFTDIQDVPDDPVIMVWWPRVTITNENDRSVNIQDLYAKVKINSEGRIPYESRGFQLNRTTFPEVQFACGYLHSHIPHFSGVPHFNNPCLGSGPINNTIMDLKNGYEESLWMLFCQELALYVTVESLRGGPYFRMEQIGSEKLLMDYRGYTINTEKFDDLSRYWTSDENKEIFKELLKRFITYYLQNGHLSLNFKNGRFVVGMPYFNYIIDISNTFIDFVNRFTDRSDARITIEGWFNRKILVKALAANGKFYESNRIMEHDFSQYEGQRVLTFKGEDKLLHIEPEAEIHTEVTILLSHRIAMYILHNVLKIINYRFRNEHNNNTDRASEASAPTYQTVIYL